MEFKKSFRMVKANKDKKIIFYFKYTKEKSLLHLLNNYDLNKKTVITLVRYFFSQAKINIAN